MKKFTAFNHKISVYFVRITAWITFFVTAYILLSTSNLWYDCPALSLTCVLSTCFVDFKIDYANMSPLTFYAQMDCSYFRCFPNI